MYKTDIVKTALDTYVADVTRDGWHPKVIVVNNVEDPQADYVCPRPEELKQVIRQYQRNGLKGFVIIGSSPAIPTAYWRHHTNCDPSDLFYADMSDWGPVTDNGAYMPYTPEVTKEALAVRAPELFWGRIDAMGISEDMDECAQKTAAYLNKVHQYRVNGSNLPPEAIGRYVVAGDGNDYKGVRYVMRHFKKLAGSLHGVYDDSLTTAANWKKILEEGHTFGMLWCHSGNTGHAFEAVQGETSGYRWFTLDYLDDLNPRFHYLDLFCCSACRFEDTKDGHLPNLGATYLFNNDYMLNVTGSSGGWGFIPEERFWTAMAAGKPIGLNVRDYFADWMPKGEQGCPKGMVLGDPTLKLKLPEVENAVPFVTTRFEAPRGIQRLDAIVGVPFTITTFDHEDDPVTIDLQKLPKNAKLQHGSNYLVWTPSADKVGEILPLTVVVSDDQHGPGHEYIEDFHVRVIEAPAVDVPNGDFEAIVDKMPVGWTVGAEEKHSVALAPDAGLTGAALRLKANEDSIALSKRTLTLKPCTRYVLTGYVRTDDLTPNGNNEGGAFVSIGDNASQIIIRSTDEWVPVQATGKTDKDGKIDIACGIGFEENPVVGTAWFDNLKLYEMPKTEPKNLDFETLASSGLPEYWAANLWPEPPTSVLTDTNVKHAGNVAIRLEALDKPFVTRTQQIIDVEANTRYRMTGYVKTENVVDGYGATLGVGKQLAEGVKGDADWQQVSVEFDTKGQTSVKLTCCLGISGSENHSTGKAWFDDLTVERVGPSPVTEDKPEKEKTAQQCRLSSCN